MSISPYTLEEKSYTLCINCAHIGKECGGANFLAMEIHQLCDWCRIRKEYLHSADLKWTNAYIAEQAKLSKVSIDRFLSGNIDDIKFSTASSIVKVLVGDAWGQSPCIVAVENAYADAPGLAEKAEAAIAQCESLQATIDRMNSEHKETLTAIQEESQRKVDYLKDQVSERSAHLTRKNRIINILAILLGIAVLAIITALVFDAIDPTRGFFWLSARG